MMWKLVLLIIAGVFLVGCQSPSLHAYYAPKSAQLTRILNDCHTSGQRYMLTNPTCVKAAEKGIYWDLPHYYKNCCCCWEKHAVHAYR